MFRLSRPESGTNPQILPIPDNLSSPHSPLILEKQPPFHSRAPLLLQSTLITLQTFIYLLWFSSVFPLCSLDVWGGQILQNWFRNLMACPAYEAYHLPKRRVQALGLENFPSFEIWSNNGIKKKSHFNNLIKLCYFHVFPLSLFSSSCLCSWKHKFLRSSHQSPEEAHSFIHFNTCMFPSCF